MAGDAQQDRDSRAQGGGGIPGLPGCPAFSLILDEPSLLPVLISVPHAGRTYPAPLLSRMRNPGFATLKLEDRYADLIGREVAQRTGAALLVAHAPRAMIDLNRAADDIDWDMFVRGAPADSGGYSTGSRARSGLGLIPRRIPGVGELWKRRHDESDLRSRIDSIHRPYHDALSAALAALRERWGAALLIDLHSMPPIAPRGGQGPCEFVVGDRFGAACHGSLAGSVFAWFAEQGRLAAHNRPYAGGYVLDRHGAPADGIHALQLEVDRTSYLDARSVEPGPGFGNMVELLAGLVTRLADEVVQLPASASIGLREAAE